MNTLVDSVKVFASVFLLLYVASLLSPFSWLHLDMVGLLLIYTAWRKHGLVSGLWLVAILSFIHFGLDAPHLQWPPLVATYGLALVFKRLFRHIYVESYLIETLHVLFILALSLVFQHLFFALIPALDRFFAAWFVWRLVHLVPTTIIAFALFIGLDKLFRDSVATPSA